MQIIKDKGMVFSLVLLYHPVGWNFPSQSVAVEEENRCFVFCFSRACKKPLTGFQITIRSKTNESPCGAEIKSGRLGPERLEFELPLVSWELPG